MKKLTAGIFSVLMGLVSVNAAEAAVASKGYVDTKVGLNTEAIEAMDLGAAAEEGKYVSTVAQEDGKVSQTLKSFDSTVTQNGVNAPSSGAVHTFVTDAMGNMETAVDLKQDKLTAGDFVKIEYDADTGNTNITTTYQETDSVGIAGDGKISVKFGAVDASNTTQAVVGASVASAISDLDAAYKAADSALDTRVTANTNAITGLQTSKADKGTKLSDYGITDAYTRSETDTKIADAVKGTMEGDVSTILGDYLKKTEAETIYESIAAAKATNDAQDIKITANTDALTVLNGNASVEGSVAKSISDALAPYSTTVQVQGLINSATTDMATNSSVNTALSNYTNTTDLTTLLNGKQDNLSGSDAVKIDNNVVSIIADSITGAMIKDLTIDTDDIKDGAVTSAKLAGGSVTAEKLGTGAVGDNAVSALSQSKITGLEDALSAKFVAPAYEAVTDNGTYVLTATKEGDEIKYAWEDITRN